MNTPKKFGKAQEKIWDLVKPKLINQSFLEEVEYIRQLPGHAKPIYTSHLMLAYDIPTSAGRLVEHFIETGKKDRSLIELPIQVISHFDKTVVPSDDPHHQWRVHQVADTKYVGLVFNYDVTKDEIIEFIDKNYSKYIKPKLEMISGKRKSRRPRHLAARDLQVYMAHADGKSAKEIAEAEGLSEDYVRVIVSRQKAYHFKKPL